MYYYITDPEKLHRIIRRVSGHAGISDYGQVKISLTNPNASLTFPLIYADGVADREIRYEGKKSHLRIIMEPLDSKSGFYHIKKAVFGRREIKKTPTNLTSTVRYTIPVDVNSSIALYGRSVKAVCRIARMEREIRSTFQRFGYGIRDCTVGFYYNNRLNIINEIEEDGRPFILLDSLRNLTAGGADFFTPRMLISEKSGKSQKSSSLFISYNISRIRSEFIYPFCDHQKNPMGFIRINSPSPVPGAINELRIGDFASSTLAYLYEKSEEILYQLEMDIHFPMKKLCSTSTFTTLDKQSLILTAAIERPPSDLLPGSRVSFIKIKNKRPWTTIATVKKLFPTPHGISLLLRIQEETSHNTEAKNEKGYEELKSA